MKTYNITAALDAIAAHNENIEPDDPKRCEELEGWIKDNGCVGPIWARTIAYSTDPNISQSCRTVYSDHATIADYHYACSVIADCLAEYEIIIIRVRPYGRWYRTDQVMAFGKPTGSISKLDCTNDGLAALVAALGEV